MKGPTTKGRGPAGRSSRAPRPVSVASSRSPRAGIPFWRSRGAASACAPSPTRSAPAGRLEPPVADLSTTAGVEALLARAAPLELELLVNNAGVATYGAFAASRAERERELVRVNVEAIVALTGGLLPALLACGHGGVINVASQMAFQPRGATLTACGAAKSS